MKKSFVLLCLLLLSSCQGQDLADRNSNDDGANGHYHNDQNNEYNKRRGEDHNDENNNYNDRERRNRWWRW